MDTNPYQSPSLEEGPEDEAIAAISWRQAAAAGLIGGVFVGGTMGAVQGFVVNGFVFLSTVRPLSVDQVIVTSLAASIVGSLAGAVLGGIAGPLIGVVTVVSSRFSRAACRFDGIIATSLCTVASYLSWRFVVSEEMSWFVLAGTGVTASINGFWGGRAFARAMTQFLRPE